MENTSDLVEFKEFQKIPRLSRDMIITEKIDGTNGMVHVSETGEVRAGSRNRWITPEKDNFGFAKWVEENKEELKKLGAGYHYGEWWGDGIQRHYGIVGKRWSLFNLSLWTDDAVRPKCCHVVPELYRGLFNTPIIEQVLNNLKEHGSVASPGFMRPEGIVIFHIAKGYLFKKTIEGDDNPKSICK